MMPPRKQSRRAFTLLEVLASAVILAAALAVIINSIAHSSYSAVKAVTQTSAANIADEVLAQAAKGEIANLPAKGSRQAGTYTYTWQLTSEPHKTDNITRLKCTVTWTVRSRRQELSAQRLIVSSPPGDPGQTDSKPEEWL